MVTYRLALEEDYTKINNFFNRIHGSNRSIDVFYWEFHNCPFGKSIYVIAEDEDRIVGTNCVIPIELESFEGNVIKSGKSEDTLVDPEYRGQNIFNNIYQFLFQKCEEQGIQVIWGYTPAKKPFSKLGFSLPFDHKQSLAVNKILKSYNYLISLNKKNNKIDKLKILGLCIMSKVKLFEFTKKANLKEFKIVENQDVTEGVNDLIVSNLEGFRSSFAIKQNKIFQDWRIYKNPNYFKVHTFAFYNSSNDLKALVVLNSHKNEVAYFCQSSFHSDLTNDEICCILSYCRNKMFNAGIAMLRNWHFDHTKINEKEIENFKKVNFMFLNRGITFVWKNLGNNNFSSDNFILSRISTQGVI